MRVCMIGNSHMSKFYQKWECEKENLPLLSLDFYLERLTGRNPLTIKDSTDNDATTIEDVLTSRLAPLQVDSYDVFVVFSLGLSYEVLCRLHEKYSLDSVVESSDSFIVTKGFFNDAALSILNNSKAGRVIKAIRKYSKKPIIVVPQPYPMEWVKKGGAKKFKAFNHIVSLDLAHYINQIFKDYLNSMERDKVYCLEQPADTVVDHVFTKLEYGLADVNDTSDSSLFSKGDYFHANSKYADIVWEGLINQINGVVLY